LWSAVTLGYNPRAMLPSSCTSSCNMFRLLLASVIACLLGVVGVAQAPLPTVSPPDALAPADSYLRSERLGITFISSVDERSSQRYRHGLQLGAGWNRWPLYWDRVEAADGAYHWAAYDDLLADDLAHGLHVNAILLGRPGFHAEGRRIAGLHEPIFADGTDTPGEGKSLNPANPWVHFVDAAVTRYRPGGALARARNWPADAGIRVWEIWNEPDHVSFWESSPLDYARLLKTAYLVIHWRDPDATVMFGGLLFGTGDNWLAQVLAIYEDDPFREQHNWYMDAIGLHSYAYPWCTGWLLIVVRQTLIAYGIDRPVWLNESGVPVWDDYPGPTWTADEPDQRQGRATLQQQARYVIQNSALAFARGASVVFVHQLYDDCGDQAAGTNFPPHDGQLCEEDEETQCWGDAFGVFRNEASSICFSQHPFAGTQRPMARAYQLVADVFGQEPFVPMAETFVSDAIFWLNFARPASNQQIVVAWNQSFDAQTIVVPALGTQAEIRTIDGARTVYPVDGNYAIDLPVATPDSYGDTQWYHDAAIGGPPIILIETASEPLQVATAPVPTLEVTVGPLPAPDATASPTLPSRLLQPTPGAVFTAAPSPTPEFREDREPPRAVLEPLPAVSGPQIGLRWRGEDNRGIDRYFVWVRRDGGEWERWLETQATSAVYDAAPGHRYAFTVWALDLAGNWSVNLLSEPQAETRVE
jgi:hypothetical protein